MGFRLNVEKLKEEFVGKIINWLTVIDVYRDDNNIVMFKCKCRCGTIKSFSKKLMLSKKPRISCGCYKTSPEKSAQKLQYYKDHPELKDYLSNKRKQFCKDNPEIAAQIGAKNKQLYIDDPSRRQRVSEWISNWFKNNHDEVAEWSSHRRDYYKSHPEIGEARSQLYKSCPDIVDRISLGNKKFSLDHPDKVEYISQLNRLASLEKRRLTKYTDEFLECVHPNYISDLLSGHIKARSTIVIRCPICGNYAEHKFNTKMKNSIVPMCKSCHVNLTSCFTSRYEDEIANYILRFYNGKLVKNDRSILNGKELDLYYPERKIAVEFNGDYWHNEDHKPYNYHFEKFKLCLEKNILLVSVFESEWVNRRDDILSYLEDLFNGKTNKLSFEKEGYMNNNYPSFEREIDLACHLDDSYRLDDSLVYTCGYSRLIDEAMKNV